MFPDTDVTADRRQTIVGLHYIRAIATVMVVAVHAFGVVARPAAFGVHGAGGFFEFGAGEIDFFFMMSGFIMVASTHNPTTNVPRMTAVEFFRRRATRLMPMLWLSIVTYAILRHPGRTSIEEALAYARAFVLWPIGQVSPWVAWTIRFEVLFYLIFGVCFIAYRKLALVGILWFFAPLIILAPTTHIDPEGSSLLLFLFSPFNLEFGLGVAIGFLYCRLGRPVTFRYQLTALICIFALVRALVWFTKLKANSLVFVFTVAPICITAIVFAIKTDPENPWKPAIFIGDASYSIFLFHPHTVNLVVLALAKLTPWMPPSLAATLTTAIAVGLTSLIHLFIEKPIVGRAKLFFHTFPKGSRVKSY